MFRFPLQRLLELKARREQELARQLALATQDAARAAAIRDELRQLQACSAEQLAGRTQEAPTVGELVSLGYTISQLGEQVEEAQTRVDAAEQHAASQNALLTSAVRDRQVLDRLRERRFDEFRAEESQRDRNAMDAIALGRFVSQKAPKTSPPEGTT